MATYQTEIEWTGGSPDFIKGRYSRAHKWRFDGGQEVHASSSPHVVRLPYSDPSGVDPEEALVASLSSCHMLWFLDLAAQKGFSVERYTDRASGEMGKNSEGRECMARAVPAPQGTMPGDKIPTASELHAPR